jgi:hypothetical protein
MKNSIFAALIIGAIASSIVVLTAIPASYADKGGKPNDKASDVAKSSGATDNKEFFQGCKDSGESASDCAHEDYNNGKFMRDWAHSVNKP